MSTPHINALREHLMETLASLRDRDNPMEPDRARAIGQVASVLIESAKVEVDFLRVTHSDRSDFLGRNEEQPPQIGNDGGPSAHNPFPGVTRHRLNG